MPLSFQFNSSPGMQHMQPSQQLGVQHALPSFQAKQPLGQEEALAQSAALNRELGSSVGLAISLLK